MPPAGTSYDVEYHDQPYVTGASSSLGASQQYPQQLPAVPITIASSTVQGLTYGGFYGSSEQPPRDFSSQVRNILFM